MTRNTSNNAGMVVSNGIKDMSEHDWINDTRKPKWAVDVERDPSHVQILDNFPGGTKWTMNTALVASNVETLFAMEHHMPFPPKFLCFFYTKDAPSGFAIAVGKYTQNRAFMLYNAISLGEEGLFAQVDEKYFYIKHFVDTFGIGSGNNTFYGSDYKFRIRFELLNQPALYLGNKGY